MIVAYCVLNTSGTRLNGEMVADNLQDAKNILINKQYVIISCTPKEQFKQQPLPADRMCSSMAQTIFTYFITLLKPAQTINLLDLANLCFHLSAFDRAGLSIVDGLEEISHFSNKPLIRRSLAQILSHIRSGMTFSQSLAQQKFLYDEKLISLMRIAEKTGCFHTYLSQAETYFRWQHNLQQTVRQAIRYPLILLFFLCILLFITFTILVPNLHQHLQILGIHNHSLATNALLSLAEFSQVYGVQMIMTLTALMTYIYLQTLFSKKARIFLTRLLLNIPFIGKIQRQLGFLDFFQSLGLMLQGNIDVLPAIQQAVRGVKNAYIKDQLSCIPDRLIQGATLSQSLETIDHLPSVLYRYVQLGEKTGDLSPILNHACQHQFTIVKKQLDDVVSWIQPALVIFMGALLIWIITAILVPLYDNISVMEF